MGGLDVQSPCERPQDVAGRIARPRIVGDDDGVGRKRPQPPNDTRPEYRALTDAERSIKDGEARGQDVRRDDLRLPLASEEEKCVLLRVLERREALVRARRPRSSCRLDGDADVAREPVDVLIDRRLEQVDVASAPEGAFHRARCGCYRPRAIVDSPTAPEPVE